MKSLTNNLFQAFNRLFLRSEFDRLLASSMFFGSILSILRVIHTGKTSFFFMTWNLFLGYVPYMLSTWLANRGAAHALGNPGGSRAKSFLRQPQTLIIGFIWVLFIPNAFYMLTDLFHLSDNYRDARVPQWYDLILVLSFALNGLLLGVLSIRQMEKLFVPKKSGTIRMALFLYPTMFLNALGVYIGRYMRYNSWNIVTHPFRLITDIALMILHPIENLHAWGMVFCFTILLSLVYRLMKKFSQALI